MQLQVNYIFSAVIGEFKIFDYEEDPGYFDLINYFGIIC